MTHPTTTGSVGQESYVAGADMPVTQATKTQGNQ